MNKKAGTTLRIDYILLASLPIGLYVPWVQYITHIAAWVWIGMLVISLSAFMFFDTSMYSRKRVTFSAKPSKTWGSTLMTLILIGGLWLCGFHTYAVTIGTLSIVFILTYLSNVPVKEEGVE